MWNVLRGGVFLVFLAASCTTDFPETDAGQDEGLDGPVELTDGTADGETEPFPITIGCADGTAEQEFDSGMVLCEGAANQCEAERLCNVPSWHLCTYDEYAALGGAETMPAFSAWLRSCVRLASPDLVCPSIMTCEECIGIHPIEEYPITWTCGDAPEDLDMTEDQNLGAVTWPQSPPRKVGCPEAACAFAKVENLMVALGAACCRN